MARCMPSCDTGIFCPAMFRGQSLCFRFPLNCFAIINLDFARLRLNVIAILLSSILGLDAGHQARADLQFVEPAVAYQPRYYNPDSETDLLTVEQIVEDLRLLRIAGFRSLVTYGSDGLLAEVPSIAREEGFDGTVIMGIWNPLSDEDLQRAAEKKADVDGYAVGNEGLDLRFYDTAPLERAMAFLRESTGRPVTTTEPIDSYLTGPYRDWLLQHSDWLFPSAHPFWATTFDHQRASDWIITRHDLLAISSRLPVVLKEVGFPTSCEVGCSEEEQLKLFKTLETSGLSFMYFEAFDQPWKSGQQKYGDAEAYWGLFDKDGRPKKTANWLMSEMPE